MISKIEKIVDYLSDEGKNEEVSSRREFLGNLAKIGAVAIAGNEISDRILGDEAEAHGKRHEHKTVEDYYKEGDYRQAERAFISDSAKDKEDYVYRILSTYKLHGKDAALNKIRLSKKSLNTLGRKDIHPYLEGLARRIIKDHHVDDFSIKAYSNYLKGMEYIKQKKYSKAYKTFKESIKLDPFNRLAHVNLRLVTKYKS